MVILVASGNPKKLAELRRVLDEVSIEDVLTGHFPEEVSLLAQDPQAWQDRWPLRTVGDA